MRWVAGRVGGAAIAAGLVFPALAFGMHVTSGVFTSWKADISVAKGGSRITVAQINCKQVGHGQTLQEIQFSAQPIKITRSGSYAYRGQAFYDTFGHHTAKVVTASISGRFVTSKRVTGKVTGGPGACRSVRFFASYNPRARP